MAKVPVSVVVITRNEKHNIDECMTSVMNWADEIIVVDDESTDGTAELARKYTGRVFQRRMDNEGRHRNWAYAQAKNEWVLSLDADERATPELRQAADQALAALGGETGFTFPRRNYIGNHWLRHGGQYPAAQLRLFKKSKFRYEEVGVHPRAFLDGKAGHLQGDIIHYSYRDFAHFVAKLNTQTTLEAEKWAQTGRKMTLGVALWRTIDRFFRSYVGKKGYKDGFIGFMMAYFASLYQIISYAKYYEIIKGMKQKT